MFTMQTIIHTHVYTGRDTYTHTRCISMTQTTTCIITNNLAPRRQFLITQMSTTRDESNYVEIKYYNNKNTSIYMYMYQQTGTHTHILCISMTQTTTCTITINLAPRRRFLITQMSTTRDESNYVEIKYYNNKNTSIYMYMYQQTGTHTHTLCISMTYTTTCTITNNLAPRRQFLITQMSTTRDESNYVEIKYYNNKYTSIYMYMYLNSNEFKR